MELESVKTGGHPGSSSDAQENSLNAGINSLLGFKNCIFPVKITPFHKVRSWTAGVWGDRGSSWQELGSSSHNSPNGMNNFCYVQWDPYLYSEKRKLQYWKKQDKVFRLRRYDEVRLLSFSLIALFMYFLSAFWILSEWSDCSLNACLMLSKSSWSHHEASKAKRRRLCALENFVPDRQYLKLL